MNARLGPEDLRAYMQTNAIPGEIVRLDTPTPTVGAAAKAVGADPDSIIKSILFLVDDRPVLAITSGIARVDRRAIAALYQVGRKRVKLASPEAVLKISGYEVGAMPPFGHREPLATLLDSRVLEKRLVYGGGGAEDNLLRLAPADIQTATGARVADLLNPPDQVA